MLDAKFSCKLLSLLTCITKKKSLNFVVYVYSKNRKLFPSDTKKPPFMFYC